MLLFWQTTLTISSKTSKEKKFTLEGLIADAEFKQEFSLYRREASEAPANSVLLLPSLDEAAVSAMLLELEKLQAQLKEDAQRLPECLRLISKTTGQYMTEIDYEASAATEEADAKIRAQEQIVNPQVAQLNRDYSRKIKETAAGFDNELESLEKLKTKTEQFIKRNQEETKQYVREAKAHAAKGHEVYEKRWKEKIKKAQKELGGLKKELGNQENQTKKLTSQKTQAISQLTLELDREVKLVRQPLLELEAARDVKVRFFKQETQKLLLQEKPVIEGLNKTMRLREEVTANFDALSLGEAGLKAPALFYVPFYVACYEAGLSRRYLVVPPSTVSNIDFSSKLRGALGMSKAREILVARFKTVAALVGSVGVYVKQNSAFESQLWDLSQRNNLLRASTFQENAKRGLTYLKQAGWLSDREEQELSRRLFA